MHAIIDSKGDVDPFKIAEYYVAWKKTMPRDIGFATSAALDILNYSLRSKDKFEKGIVQVKEANKASKSNGALMRTTPLAVLCRNKSNEDIISLTKKDVQLTHGNRCILYSVALYNIAIAHLLNNHNDAQGAIKVVDDQLKKLSESDSSTSQYEDLLINWEVVKTTDSESQHELIQADDKIGKSYPPHVLLYSLFYRIHFDCFLVYILLLEARALI